jgi:Fe-S-cluster containining protein
MAFEKNCEQASMFAPYLDRLADVFRKMDGRYEGAAAEYGFVCSGCEDSCCRTRFYHHTLIEYHYLKIGLDSLSSSDRAIVQSRALETIAYGEHHSEIAPAAMCPLNEDGRCRLYAYRPMICRLHGLPHELNHPVKGRVQSPGCHEFVIQCCQKAYIPFDRTPLYREMAVLEKSFRQETGIGIGTKMKMTVADILADVLT